MASMAEALGMTLSGNAAIPASDSRRMALAELSGRRAVEMALAGGPKPSEILTAKAFDNAIRADMAIGGSTNAVIHLVAIAGRAGIDLPLRRFDELSRTTPLLVNVRPSGKYLMEDFFYAGGLPVVLKELLPLLHGEASTVAGTSLAHVVADAKCWNEDVIRSLAMPIAAEGGTVILTGNLCPGGAVVLHVSPESAVGGPLALVRNGDEIELDVPKRTLALRIGDDELARRRAAWTPRPPHFARGYGRLFLDHVLQANEGCDFDFLRGGTPVRLEDTRSEEHTSE